MRNILLVGESDNDSTHHILKAIVDLDVKVFSVTSFEEARTKCVDKYVSIIVFNLYTEYDVAPYIKQFQGASTLLCYRDQQLDWFTSMLSLNFSDEYCMRDSDRCYLVVRKKLQRLIDSRFSKRLYGLFNALVAAYPFPIVTTRAHVGENPKVIFYNEPFQKQVKGRFAKLNDLPLNLFEFYGIDKERDVRKGAIGYHSTKYKHSEGENTFRKYEVYLIPVNNVNTNGVEYNVAFEFEVTTDVSLSKKLMQELDENRKKLKGQEEFLANVAHDIRKPLNNIVGLIEMLNDGSKADDVSDIGSALSLSSKNLRKMIDDLLDLSKIGSGNYEIVDEFFDVRAFIDGLRIVFENEALKKNLDLQISISDNVPAIIKGDENRLSQILTNLLGNAFKFTSEGSVKMSIDVASISDKQVLLDFVVADTGIGVKPENIVKLFRSYSQAEKGQDRKYGGTGLGLSICRKLAELMGGSISVESEWGKGTTFSVTLPFSLAALNGDIMNGSEHNKSLDDITVILVDDNELTNHVLSNILQRWDANVRVYTGATEALEYQGFVDLLITDIQLPDTNGMELSRKMKKRYEEQGKALPVLGISAFPYPLRKYSHNTLDAFLLKPLDSKELFTTIARLHANRASASLADKGKLMEYRIIDVDKIRGFASGDPDFIRQLIEIFLKRTPEYMEELNKAVKAKDWARIKMMAHKVKPTFTYVGMEAFTEKVGSIEHMSIKKDIVGIQSIMSEVWDKCQLAFDEFEAFSKSMDE